MTVGGQSGARSSRLLRRLTGVAPAGDTSPTGQVTYARSLDGRHLWIAVEGPASGLALRVVDSGREVGFDELGTLGEVAAGDQLSACVPLEPPADLVLVDRTGPVPPAPQAVVGDADSLTQAPAVDGWRPEVSTAEGAVRISWRRSDDHAVVRGFDVDGDRVRIAFDTDLAAPTAVLLVTGSAGTVATVPVERTDPAGPFTADVSAALPSLEPGVEHQVRVLSADADVALVRHRNGLRRPGGGIAMPRVPVTYGERDAMLRLRFVQTGVLTVRLAPNDDGGGPR